MYHTQGNNEDQTQGMAGVGAPQSQMGQQMGNYVNPHYLAREQAIAERTANFTVPVGGQAQTGERYMGQAQGMQGNWQAGQRFGAHELLMTHEVLTDSLDGINQFELYRPHIRDQKLMQILDSQINHMYNSYQNLVNYLHHQGGSAAVPYRVPRASSVKYGLRQPSPIEPNTDLNQMDDRDVASGMMGCAKASAAVCTTAALECADPALREMITNCTVSSINQAYELFLYMNQQGMYQVPTLAEQTTQTVMNSFQTGSQPMTGAFQTGTQDQFRQF